VNASQWIMVAAMLLGPVLAIQIQKFLEARRELRRTRMNLFHTLMQMRGNRLDPAHVQALNSIDLLFHKDKKVMDAWRIYHDHLTSLDRSPSDAQLDQWVKRDEDYLVELLAALSRVLGYDFDAVRAEASDLCATRPCRASVGLRDDPPKPGGLLSGKQAIPVRLTDAPDHPSAAASTDYALRLISITPAQPRLSVARQEFDAEERCITSKFSVSPAEQATPGISFTYNHLTVRQRDEVDRVIFRHAGNRGTDGPAPGRAGGGSGERNLAPAAAIQWAADVDLPARHGRRRDLGYDLSQGHPSAPAAR
jgi:hypothetical protein